MSEKYQLTRPAELDSLADFRRFMEEACQRAGLDDETTYDLMLAVDEAVTNIIEHGYAGMEPGTIMLSLQHGAAQMVLRLTDFGHPFEPGEPPTPDVEEVFASGEAAGYGLVFIYRSVDEVRYEATASGNTLTLIKRFKEGKLA